MVGFSVAEHHFAQQVDVLSDFLLCTGGQMLRELRTRFVDDDLRGVHAQALLDDGDGDKVEMMAECLIHSEQEAVPLVQKFGNAVLVEKGFDTFGKYPSVTDLRRFIQHLHEEFLVLRTLHHDSIFMLFAAFGFCDGLLTGIVQFEYPILYFGKGRLILFVHKNLNYVNGENVKKESQIAIYIVRRVGLNITAR